MHIDAFKEKLKGGTDEEFGLHTYIVEIEDKVYHYEARLELNQWEDITKSPNPVGSRAELWHRFRMWRGIPENFKEKVDESTLKMWASEYERTTLESIAQQLEINVTELLRQLP